MKAKFNDTVKFRLDGRVEGIGVVTEVHSHSYHVDLTKPCKEFDAGVVIIVDAREVYDIISPVASGALEIVERSSGFYVVDGSGIVAGPFDDLDGAKLAMCYPGCVCPDCNAEIERTDFAPGDDCGNCGHVYCFPAPDDDVI